MVSKRSKSTEVSAVAFYSIGFDKTHHSSQSKTTVIKSEEYILASITHSRLCNTI